MKKLLTIVVMLTTFTNASAQIKVQQSFTNDLIIIGNLSGGKVVNVIGNGQAVAEHKLYCRILHENITYGILIHTPNKFDDDFEFALGTDIDTAKESLTTMLEFMQTNSLKTSLTVKDEDDRTIQLNLTTRKKMTLNAIDAQGAVICGDVVLTAANLERALKLLDNKAERKVAEAIARNNK